MRKIVARVVKITEHSFIPDYYDIRVQLHSPTRVEHYGATPRMALALDDVYEHVIMTIDENARIVAVEFIPE